MVVNIALSLLRPVLLLACLVAPVIVSATPPPPPASGPVRQGGSGGNVLSDADRVIWEQAFSLADRGLHSAASLASKAARDGRLATVLEWMRLRDSGVKAPKDDYDRFLKDHADFPSLSLIAYRREQALLDGADAAELRRLFTKVAPVTPDGRAQWALQLADDGKRSEALALARRVWREDDPDRKLEDDLYRSFRRDLDADDHWRRLDRLLWDYQSSAASRMKGRVSADVWRLANARLRLRGRSAGVDQAVAAVPARLQSDPGLIYERVRFRRKTGQDSGAQDLLLASGVLGGETDRIWIERRIQFRNLVKEAAWDKAYRMARDHGVPSGAAFAQAEFEAGWIALRFLGKPRQALKHFQTLFDNVSYPVSRSRGAYWSARAYLALGDAKSAEAWFAEAAGHPFTYYGQLAAHELGSSQLTLRTPPSVAGNGQQSFNAEKLPAIIIRLHEIGENRLAKHFLAHLVKTSSRPDIHVLTAGLVDNLDSPAVTLTAGKLAALDRVVIPQAAYPVVAAPGRQGHIPAELAHAITRQESAFDQYAISHAGARGLMQLMPATAKRVAQSHNIAYSRTRLTQDPAYNTRLGGAYLADQIQRFSGYLPMAAAAYNAGPHRVDRWLGDYGDPRAGAGDPVDWIETIPFSETRNYVQRVMEALQVYRVRLSGQENGRLTLAADIGLTGTYLCGGRTGNPC